MRELIILTGPPGGGKASYADTLPHNVYDQASGNKAVWRDDPGTAVLITAAPGADQKISWCGEARRFGFTPRVLVVDPGKGRATQQLVKREMQGSQNERRKARLAKTCSRWYAAYSPHPEEDRVAT